jgi:hypothetical protein
MRKKSGHIWEDGDLHVEIDPEGLVIIEGFDVEDDNISRAKIAARRDLLTAVLADKDARFADERGRKPRSDLKMPDHSQIARDLER